MKKTVWRKHHKWLGLVLAFFILMFCLSGIVLNHPRLFAGLNVSRKLLPADYEYRQWNRGLMRGTLRWHGQVLLYGNSGIWITDSTVSCFRDFNAGLPVGADYRNIRGMTLLPSDQLAAAGVYGLYMHDGRTWHLVSLPLERGERLSDITSQGDTLIVTGRSHVYLSRPPYHHFRRLTLSSAPSDDGRVSLFRTVWLLHSGELFGTAGRLAVDAVALFLIFISLTGVLYWLAPRLGRRSHAWLMTRLFGWHNDAGRLTIVFTLLICITGWLLRPPALVAIASGRVPPVPFSTMDSSNAWHDRLRCLRYDPALRDWLLYTSEGFYSLRSLAARPQPEPMQPPVSVMGLNAACTDGHGSWLVGSFSGLYEWDRKSRRVIDWFSHDAPQAGGGMPIGNHAIAGYSTDFNGSGTVVDYYTGAAFAPMPQWMQTLPMSLRNVCLEIHTGRIYTFLGQGGVFYIFVMGIAIFWCLWTGWKIRLRRRCNRNRNYIQSGET